MSTTPLAFPAWKDKEHFNQGMTLRDYFAASAMQGMLSNSRMTDSITVNANTAYLIADAMLKVRSL